MKVNVTGIPALRWVKDSLIYGRRFWCGIRRNGAVGMKSDCVFIIKFLFRTCQQHLHDRPLARVYYPGYIELRCRFLTFGDRYLRIFACGPVASLVASKTSASEAVSSRIEDCSACHEFFPELRIHVFSQLDGEPGCACRDSERDIYS